MQSVVPAAGAVCTALSVIRKPPALGYQYWQQLEWSTASGTSTWYGTDGTPVRRTGMAGWIMG
jgi:hypothetical protein